ncbi:hypothetical protein VTK73DRAFT_9236 [Phialemonium thermophilum]|uniref:Chitin-binding type-1 domain-containing protein n=1 Tax=Phialemonium thermophilum TaxID=223376 RepID=A0ABR3W3J2_9PEZI
MRWIDISLAAGALGFAGSSLAKLDVGGRSGGFVNLFPGGSLFGGRGEVVSDGFGNLERRQSAGTCGPTNGNAVCPGNQCCSQFGYCGEGDQFCPAIVGCQPQYGWCEGQPLRSPTGSSTTPPATSSTSATSTSAPASPTSSSTATSSSISVPTPTGTLVASTNGMCGNTTTCAGSRYGSCCSQFWYCGTGDAYCGAGCIPEFGTCGNAPPPPASSSSSSSSIAPPPTSSTTSTTVAPPPTSTTSTPVVPTTTTTTSSAAPSASLPAGQRTSTDGTCGNGVSCIGFAGGSCCSQFGYCGTGDYFCAPIAGCQAQFGTCDPS